MFDLSKRVALVTGAGRGVGVGIAQALAAQGARVAVNDLHAARAERTAVAIRERGGTALPAAFDVTDADAVAVGVARVRDELGSIDILVNNAGIPEGMAVAHFRDLAPAEWRRFIDLNLYGVLNCTKAVIDAMCERRFGRVITISSVAGQSGIGLGISLYGAGKGGAIAFMRHLAIEVAATGVTVNALALGLMRDLGVGAGTAELARMIPIGRVGTPEDVGAAVVYLASDEASWMTGQTIGLNGGSLTT